MTRTAIQNRQPDTSLYTSLAVFLLGSIALVVNSGYSAGSTLLFLGGMYAVFKPHTPRLEPQDWLVLGALAAYGMVGMVEIAVHESGLRYLDKPLRFILATTAFALVRAYPPRLSWLWGGLAVGGTLTAAWAVWQKFFLGVERASGYTYVIQFGNISMLTALLCLAGLGWAWAQPQRSRWMTLLCLGALTGLLSSLLSGSRGGWVGLPLVLLVLYRAYSDFFSTRLKVIGVSAVMGAAVLVYSVPQLGVQARVHAAASDIQQYREGNADTSLGARFEMWKGATRLFLQKPVLGWGEKGYRTAMEDLATQGKLSNAVLGFGHAHNEVVDAAAKRGIVGVIGLLVLYLVPLKLFSPSLQSPDLTRRSLAIAGVLLSVAYIDFGLSQVFFAHNSGVMIYAFWLVTLWGCYRNTYTGQ